MDRILFIPFSNSVRERRAFSQFARNAHFEGKLPGVEYKKRVGGTIGLSDNNKVKKPEETDVVVIDGSRPEIIKAIPDEENTFVIFPSFSGTPTIKELAAAKRYIARHRLVK